MSPAPVSVLMCALILCGPAQPEAAPSPCPSPAVPAPHATDTGGPRPCAAPSAGPAVRGSAVRGLSEPQGGGLSPVAAPSPVDEPVVYYTAAASEPEGAAFRVIGNASTGILMVLCAAALAMRLSVGWPRFPAPYTGQRRRDSGREGT